MRRLPTLLAVLGLTAGSLGVVACAGDGSPAPPSVSTAPSADPSPSPDAAAVGRYVALGDSFTAGPLVPQTDFAEGCLRSSGNYPSLLAATLDVGRLVDVSCSGATSADLTRRQHTGGSTYVPPQLDAVTASTDLVTLGIGGNDEGLFASLFSGCAQGPDAPETFAACGTGVATLVARAPALLRTLGEHVRRALAAVSRRAPDAQVVLVGYLRLVPRDHTCPALGLPERLLAPVARLERRLAAVQAQAARATGAAFVDMDAIAAGHDICAARPWVNGGVTDREAALAFHPFAAGMRATAAAVADAVRPG